MTAPLLQADDLAFAHPGAAPLFAGLSLDVHEHEVVALLGGSGCGKSSLLRELAGLAPARHGRLRFAGQPLRQPHPRAALLFQQPSLLPWLRVQGNVAFGLDFDHQPRLTAAERQRRVQAALAAVALTAAARQWPAQLSGGMAQRVALARALAREPLLLLADEPFSALDAITRGDMQALLLQVVQASGCAVLLVTHDLDEALAVADRVLLMQPGGLAAAWTLPPRADETARQALRPVLLQALRAVSPPAPSPVLSPHLQPVVRPAASPVSCQAAALHSDTSGPRA